LFGRLRLVAAALDSYAAHEALHMRGNRMEQTAVGPLDGVSRLLCPRACFLSCGVCP
jgi:hypothetical protein